MNIFFKIILFGSCFLFLSSRWSQAENSMDSLKQIKEVVKDPEIGDLILNLNEFPAEIIQGLEKECGEIQDSLGQTYGPLQYQPDESPSGKRENLFNFLIQRY